MESLQWVDQTYYQKHKSEDPSTLRATYYTELRMYQTHGNTSKQNSPLDAVLAFMIRYGRRAGISLVIYLLSFLPVVGRFVLPAASFYTFNNIVGPVPATVIFGSGLFLPKRYLVKFLTSFFSSRSLMRELVGRIGQSILIEDVLRSCSLSLTSLGSASQKSKRSNGSVTARVSFSVSALASISFSRSLCWVSSSTVLQKLRPRISSRRLRILRLHLHMPMVSQQVK